MLFVDMVRRRGGRVGREGEEGREKRGLWSHRRVTGRGSPFRTIVRTFISLR